MRLLVLTADYSPHNWSGIGVAVRNQAEALAEQGWDVHLIVPEERAAAVRGSGPRLHLLQRDRLPIEIRADDLLHLHSLALAELALEMQRRFRIVLLYTAHTLPEEELPGSPAGRQWSGVQREVLQHADHVFFPSRALQSLALARFPWLAFRSSVLANGVALPPPPGAAVRREGPVVFAGRFTASKGVDIAAATARDLLRRGCSADFVLAGGHGDAGGQAAARELCSDYPARCRLTGWLGRAELDRLFAEAALVLIPSRFEPFGMVALEAMRMGAPVLASGAGGLGEIVQADSGGRIVPRPTEERLEPERRGPAFVAANYSSGSLAREFARQIPHHSVPRPEEWARACQQLLDSPEERLELEQRGPAFVAANYSSGSLAREFARQIPHHSVPRPEEWARACQQLLDSPEERLELERRGPAFVAAHYSSGWLAREFARQIPHHIRRVRP